MPKVKHADHRRLSELECGQAIALYQAGWSMSDLATHFTTGWYRIRQTLLSAGVKLRSRGTKRAQLSTAAAQAVSALYATGQSIRGVAKQLKLPYSHVVHVLDQAGTVLRSKSEAHRIAWKTGRHKASCGGRKQDKHGYILINIGNGKYRFEHRLIWIQHNGPIPKGWHVHHINGVKDDNRIENLQAMPSKKHAHVIELVQKRVHQLEEKNDHLEREIAELKTDVEALRRQQQRIT